MWLPLPLPLPMPLLPLLLLLLALCSYSPWFVNNSSGCPVATERHCAVQHTPLHALKRGCLTAAAAAAAAAMSHKHQSCEANVLRAPHTLIPHTQMQHGTHNMSDHTSPWAYIGV
jgi:hypothetical protein